MRENTEKHTRGHILTPDCEIIKNKSFRWSSIVKAIYMQNQQAPSGARTWLCRPHGAVCFIQKASRFEFVKVSQRDGYFLVVGVYEFNIFRLYALR